MLFRSTPIPETPRSTSPRYAIIRVDAPNTQNAPSSISVVLDPAQPTAIPQPSPSGIFFIGATRSGSGVQSVRVDTNTSTAVRFLTSITGGSWLTATPSDGTTSATKPATISVAFDAKNLTPGIYVGGVNIGIGTTVRVVNVTLIVTTQVPSASSSMSAARDANCAPSKLALVSTGLPGNFSVPAAWPASLVIRMADDCGTLVSNGKVVVSFSNGDPPVTLLSDRISGTYSGTWNVGTVSPSMTVTATGTASGLPASTTTLVGGIIGNPTPPPAISPNGIVHNSDPRLGRSEEHTSELQSH